ncbi:MAG: CpsB/CapC family capsule biosynthesis tyrosine phosphatase [Muribaculaceae bacterium]|nr:CpsB/CapC family capsule biosynthesis tyrosine phosphatase [Muribaculaceae bacterium]
MFNFFTRSKEAIPTWFATDIHLHVVPGIDDGSPDAETSVELITDLAEMGIHRILATPHVTAMTFENNRETIEGPFKELQEAMGRHGLSGDVSLDYAAENRLDELFMKNFEEGTLITYPNKYVLIENSFVQEPWDLDNLIFELKVRGFNPIMAHPERFVYYHGRSKRYEELHRNVPFQVNMLSLAGHYGKTVKKIAENMAEAGMIDFIGTDTHCRQHTECIREYLQSRDARRMRDVTGAKLQNDLVFRS